MPQPYGWINQAGNELRNTATLSITLPKEGSTTQTKGKKLRQACAGRLGAGSAATQPGTFILKARK